MSNTALSSFATTQKSLVQLGEGHLIVRRSALSLLPMFLGVTATLSAIALLASVVPVIDFESAFDIPIKFPTCITTLFPIGVMLEFIRRYYDVHYILGPYSILKYMGRFSPFATSCSAAYVDIRVIEIEQTLLGRLLNYGNVVIHAAGPGRNFIRFSGVADPVEFAKTIDEWRVNGHRVEKAMNKRCMYKIDGQVVESFDN